MESELLEQAIMLAVTSHGGQVDKNGDPYILHPLRVMMGCWRERQGHDVMIAAVLHDVVEDTDVRLEDIRGMFGPLIANAVDALSKREGETWMDNLNRVEQNQIATIVKMHDLQDNSDFRRINEKYGLYKSYARSYHRLAIKLLEKVASNEPNESVEAPEFE